MEASLTHEAFTQNANTTFQVPIEEDRCVELELVEVSKIQLYPRQEQFAIVFRGPSEMFLDQGTRPFRHQQMGEFELFLVPIKQDEHSIYYEAIFNRIRE